MLQILTANKPQACYIFFNISANVGIGQRNDPLDVELVQLGYACQAKNPKSTAPSDLKAIFAKVIPGQRYGGGASEPLSQAIQADQRHRRVLQDGHVSRMQGGFSYGGRNGPAPFLLVTLNNHIYDVLSDAWPRIDKSPHCPPALSNAVRLILRNES